MGARPLTRRRSRVGDDASLTVASGDGAHRVAVATRSGEVPLVTWSMERGGVMAPSATEWTG